MGKKTNLKQKIHASKGSNREVGGSVWDGATIIMPGKTGGRSAPSDFDLDCMLILALEPPEHSITARPLTFNTNQEMMQ
jgi:hypothetical protein